MARVVAALRQTAAPDGTARPNSALVAAVAATLVIGVGLIPAPR